MKKGYALTLLTAAIALVQVSTTYASAPVISDPGDVIIGDLEGGATPATGTNIFVYPDAINLNNIVTDDLTPKNQLKWSFTGPTTKIRINGVARLATTLQNLNGDDPTSPRASSRLDQNDTDPGNPVTGKDSDPFTITFRNFNLTPTNATPSVGPAGFITAETTLVTLFASDCTSFGQRSITVYTARGTSDALSGGGVVPVIPPVNFGTGPQGWIGGSIAGTGSTAQNASGLCMTVPAAGSNIVLWISPERYFDLVNNKIYRVRTTVSMSNPSSPPADTIPLWFFLFDNFNTGNPGGNYGGFDWVLDVDGDAQGIGRTNGRTVYDFWFAPNAVNTPQWQTGAFTPAADPFNDPRIQFEIIDANAALLTQNDAGTICIQSINVGAINHDTLQVSSVVFNAPINTATHFPRANTDVGTATSTIDNPTGTINVTMGTTGDVRVTIGYFDNTKPNLNQQLNPAVWQGNTLYRMKMRVRAATSTANPVDAIFTAIDTATNELGAQSYTLSTAGGVMVGAASPKLTAATYEGYVSSQNATSSLVVDANRLRPIPFFFNTTALFGNGTGADAFVVESLTLEKLVTPN